MALRVEVAGLQSTIQDLGRIGFQRLGVSVSGAHDWVSLRAANMVVGNPDGLAAIEALYQGPAFEVMAESARLALGGLGAALEIARSDGVLERIPAFRSVRLERGEVIRVVLAGPAPAYLAVEGGFDLAPVLGSASTFLRARFGGIEGRKLEVGDRIPLRYPRASPRDEVAMMLPSLAPPSRIRVVLGPQDDYFSARGIETFLSSTYTVSRAADRMGLRLDGAELEHCKGFNIVSDGIAPGSVQVPGTRLPIVLLADRQTTGGYPKIATVISADLPALGRVGPGAQLSFTSVSVEEAQGARRQLESTIRSWRSRLANVAADAMLAEDKLNVVNLVSGVIDASNSLDG